MNPRYASVVVDGVLIPPDADGNVRMLPRYWSKLKPELKDLDFEAQEYVCQLCAAYVREYSPKVADAHKRARKFLARTERRLKELNKWLHQRPDLERLVHTIRLAHRPLGDRLTTLEIAGLSSPDLYFTRNDIPDPGKPLLALIESIRALEACLEKEWDFFKSDPRRTHAVWKMQGGLRKGRMEYLLQRIFRERSKPKATLKAAHERMGVIFCKLLGPPKLKLDQDKGCCPAIDNAIRRLTPEEKNHCDQRLLQNLNLPQPRN